MRYKGGLIQNRLICLDNGVWAPPRNSDHPFCEIIQCPRPRNIIHGRLISQVKIVVHYFFLPASFYNINDILMLPFFYLFSQSEPITIRPWN